VEALGAMGFWQDKKILLTGGAGFLGSHIIALLLKKGVLIEDIKIPRSNETDLRKWENCVESVKGVDLVIHLAAKVGGIGFNQKNPASLFYDNLMMGVQILEAARQEGVPKCVMLGTVCAYPKFTKVPFHEDDIWDGYPEETNAPYGLAKKMLLVQSQSYREQYGYNSIFLLPVNLYGPRDNFDPESSHVIPALIRKFIEARDAGNKIVSVWGTGNASREFLFSEDAATAIVLATEHYNKSDPVNLGAGKEIKIKDLAEMIKAKTGFQGDIFWDTTRPDGQPRRSLDTSRAKREFGFEAQVSFEAGLEKTIEWFEKARIEGVIR